ncbi:response regulator transcription factor [Flavobacterium sp. CYK-4]|uniref:response regulator n=1 Tax=Flavobacterium lotistagni TaxID=2709660 RepID=UPI001409C45F|nr:response regulator [Flavobacterium lotistagni]NHM05993.1 response regulator transcription factor [Flavobacterium lotistagni]
MNKESLNILIVDDHPAMIEGYKSILASAYPLSKWIITEVHNCELAYYQLTKENAFFDIVLLDLALPAYEPAKIFSGEDLAKLARKVSPSTKLMMLTSHTEAFILYNLLKKINPEAVLVKSDFKSEEFLKAFETIFQDGTYYSQSAQKSIREVGINNHALDTYDRRIISLLAKGIKTKNLPDHVGLSLSAIDKRKAQIKEFFEIQKGNDEDILREAQKRGLI